jgi:hypothetical protein
LGSANIFTALTHNLVTRLFKEEKRVLSNLQKKTLEIFFEILIDFLPIRSGCWKTRPKLNGIFIFFGNSLKLGKNRYDSIGPHRRRGFWLFA